MSFRTVRRFIGSTSIAAAYIGATLSPVLRADQVPVLHAEGTVHGFLIGRTPEGKVLAAGDLFEVTKGNRVIIRLVFHFKDGSIDDDRTVFRQGRTFSLVSDHHVQKGRSFSHPMDVLVDVPAGQVTIRKLDSGKEQVETTQMDLPPDLANGLTLILLKNISPHAQQTTVSYLALSPKPRIVKLAISPSGEDGFSVAGIRHKATRYVIKVEIGGIAGVVAPLIGKQPKDTAVWIAGGEAPAFVKSEGPLFVEGPLWTVEMSSPIWPGERSNGMQRDVSAR